MRWFLIGSLILLVGCIPNGGNGNGNGEPPPPQVPIGELEDGEPQIDQLFPAIGNPGDVVTVTGTGFGQVDLGRFAFDDAASLTVHSSTLATLTVPEDISNEPQVTLTESGPPPITSNGVKFRLQLDPNYDGPTFTINQTPVAFPGFPAPDFDCALPALGDPKVVIPFDADQDGDQDLFVGRRLRDGSGFDTIRLQTGLCVYEFFDQINHEDVGEDETDTRAAVALDIENDGDQDLFIARGGQSALWVNQGNGEFVSVSLAGDNKEPFWLSVGDYDGSGFLSVLETGLSPVGRNPPTPNTALWQNNGDGTFSEIARATGLRDSDTDEIGSRPGLFHDADGDGDLDILFISEDPFYENLLN